MKITLSKFSGFCDGVSGAYDKVCDLVKKEDTKKPIGVLGSLVHNDDVMNKVKDMGIEKIDFDGNIEGLEDKLKQFKTIVITAHGVGPEIYELAAKMGIEIVDTTCPKVMKVQRLAKVFFERQSQIILIGEKNHKEVQGIFDWSGKTANIVEGLEDVKNLDLDKEKEIAILSQTTKNSEWISVIFEIVKEKYPNAKLYDTVCDATKNRQEEVIGVAKDSEVVIVIGSSESSNSKRLVEISKNLNPKTYFIERTSDIERKWFKGVKKVGITAGASAPDWVIKDVVEYLENI